MGPGNGGNTRREKSPSRHPNGTTPTPIRGDFIPVSTSPSRGRSEASTAGHGVNNGRHLLLSTAYTKAMEMAAESTDDTDPVKRAGSIQNRDRVLRTPSPARSPRKSEERHELGLSHHQPRAVATLGGRSRSKPQIKAQGRVGVEHHSARSRQELSDRGAMPFAAQEMSSSQRRRNNYPSIAERRQKPRPRPIDVDLAQRGPRRPQLGDFGEVLDKDGKLHHALSGAEETHIDPAEKNSQSSYSYSSSIYSGEDTAVSPVRTGRALSPLARNPTLLRSYAQWRSEHDSTAKRGTALPATNDRAKVAAPELLERPEYRKAAYSPLTPYFSTKDMPASKKVSKTLIGDEGWLERTSGSPEKPATSPKKIGFLDNLKKKALGMVGERVDLVAHRRSTGPDRVKTATTSRLSISVEPREQSLLYCELEYLLTSIADGYITGEFNAGRLDPDKLKRVSDVWQQRGRPKVVGFRFDLETQLDLVRLHSADFQFYGRRATTAANVNGMLDTMRVNARAMRTRTFCQPDQVIAKQLLDSQALAEMLGCPLPQQIQLAEIVQFFKVILERERPFQLQSSDDHAAQSPTRRGKHGRKPGSDAVAGEPSFHAR